MRKRQQHLNKKCKVKRVCLVCLSDFRIENTPLQKCPYCKSSFLTKFDNPDYPMSFIHL